MDRIFEFRHMHRNQHARITPVNLVARIDMLPSDDNPVDPSDILRFFQAQDKLVLTFIGFSGAGYEDPEGMLEIAKRVLAEFNPRQTLVNIGATHAGIGAVYELAKRRGFTTTGIVSTRASEQAAGISNYVDHVFFVRDDTWGGFLGDTDKLSPTSVAMVDVSDIIVAIGGGAAGHDEMIVAKQLGKPVRFFPADMNHRQAIENAKRRGLPVPTEFGGKVADAFKAINDQDVQSLPPGHVP